MKNLRGNIKQARYVSFDTKMSYERIKALYATVFMSARQRFDSNILHILAGPVVAFLRLVILLRIWKSLAHTGADLGIFSISELQTYTVMASVLHPLFNVVTPATTSLWEGSLISRYTWPVPIMQSLIAETIGRQWITSFLLFSVPVILYAKLDGIALSPVSPSGGCLAVVSMIMSVTLGFDLDLLFSALARRMKNGCWAVLQVREAVVLLFSGAFIPFSMMPEKVGAVFSLLPFGSVASAPLNIYLGKGDWRILLALQLVWVVTLTAVAVPVFRRSEERMISFGG